MPKNRPKKNVEVRPWYDQGEALSQAMQTPEMRDEIAKGAGQTALSLLSGNMQPQTKTATSSLINMGIQNAAIAGDTKAIDSLSSLDAAPGSALKKQDLSSAKSSSSSGGLLKSLIESGKMLGRGLIEGALGMPESQAGSSSSIPYTLGKLPGDMARSRIGLPTSTQATLTQEGRQALSMPSQEYSKLQQELSSIPDDVLNNTQLSMPYYRALILKYPAAKAFLAEYFGLTRSYTYNYPNGLPGGKYNVGGPAVGGE